MKKIKVLHIMTSGLKREGIASTQLEFFKNMNSEKFEIYVAAVHDNDEATIADFNNNGIHVIVFPDRKKQILSYFNALVKSMKNVGPDIVHVHGSSAILCIELLAAKIAKVKIRIAHSRNTMSENEKADKLLRPIFYKLCNYNLACGKDAGEWLFEQREFTIIHNGKDFSKFCFNEELRREQREKDNLKDNIVIGHVGRLNYQKNQEYLIKVFYEFQKNHHNAILYLIGDGAYRKQYEELIDSLRISDKVYFAGSVSDVADRLQAMDLMVFPSRYEGLPNVVLEWQAEGLPCLISDKITKECAPSNLVVFNRHEFNQI